MLALVLDHGVRPAAATEAALAAAWLDRRGIAVRRLALTPPCPPSAEALRIARLAALAAAAAEAGCLDLLLAHHHGDQAETVLMRLLRGSHAPGLAAMAPWRALGPVRLVRPLLGVGAGALRDLLRAAGQPWIEDPSNSGDALRARLRAHLADRAGEGGGVRALAALATLAAADRHRLEVERDRLLAEAASIRPEGWARLDPAPLLATDRQVARAALAALLRAIGGRPQPVRQRTLEGMFAALAAGRGATAAGCLLRPQRGGFLLCREPVAVAPPAAVPPAGRLVWDGRWRVAAPPGLTVAAVGTAAAAIARTQPQARALPRPVLATLPALWADAVLVAVPPIGYHQLGFEGTMTAVFRPPQPVSTAATVRVAEAPAAALAPGGSIPS